jgi:hypothetical protein
MLGLKTSIPYLAFAILLVAPAQATTSYYQGSSGETAFNSALGNLVLLDPSLLFSGSDLGSFGLFNASGTGINFLGFDDLNAPADFTVNSGKLTATQPDQSATINLPSAGVYAFGFHLTVTSSFGSWCIELTKGTCNFSITNTSPGNVQFFGFVSDTPVTAPLYIVPSAFSPTMVLTNFEAYSTPEPQTMLLTGLGLIILGLASRKLRRAA